MGFEFNETSSKYMLSNERGLYANVSGMSKHCPTIVDMVWFGKKRAEGDEAVVCRENLVILDVDNRLYHGITHKGSAVKELFSRNQRNPCA